MIFLLAPFIEPLRRNAKLGSALQAITAAVVGVVLNLAILFTYHTLVPDTGGFDWYALAASVIAFIGLQRFKLGHDSGDHWIGRCGIYLEDIHLRMTKLGSSG